MANFLLGTGASVFAAFLLACLWWLRAWIKAGRFCGTWDPYDFVSQPGTNIKTVVQMQGNSIATIRHSRSPFQPDVLKIEGSHDSAMGRRTHRGTIVISLLSNQARLVSMYDDGSMEYLSQEYQLLPNGDILVLPDKQPFYSPHLLKRSK